jgi:hypothetical protein
MRPALILLPYFNRPKMVRTALESVKNQTDTNWKLAFIDDASPTLEGIYWLFEILEDEIQQGKVELYRVSKEEKTLLNWTTPPRYMNRAVRENDADLVMILCDDDALLPNYLENCREYFYNTNPQAVYGYSHCIPFFPPDEKVGTHLEKRPFHTNHEAPICPIDRIDASQIVWARDVQLARGVGFPENRQYDHDAGMWIEMWNHGFGECPYMGFDGQYKACHAKQLGAMKGVLDFNVSRDI